MNTESQPFDLCGPLPTPGITVLEASAGTGKTFTISALITRFVAEGIPLDAILAVTFTRMATGELRDRVRRRLVIAQGLLARHLFHGERVLDADPIVAHLAQGARAEVETRHGRLAAAVAAFDSATIATTHGFCQLVLDGLGSAGDVPAGATLLEDPADLIDEVVDDLYLRWALRHGTPGFSRADARAAVTLAVGNPDIALAPPPGEDAAGLLRRLVETAAREVTRRLREDNLLTYDHLLSRLASTLEDPLRGPMACRRLRERYRVVLVDEFQDTDPVQWRVMRQAFDDGATTLVLVGDPKQAVYSFRGADVYTYLDAARRGPTYTLDLNWRSDQPLLEAMEGLLFPLQMGDASIPFRSSKAAPGRGEPGIRDGPSVVPVRVRLVRNNQPGILNTQAKGLLQKTALVGWIAEDVARDVSRLLSSGAEVKDARRPTHDTAPRWRAVEPADVAVLTRTNKQSLAVRDALGHAGVPAVIAGLDSVFVSPAATHWLRLLEALEEPASRSSVVAAALTPFIGMTVTEATTAGERIWEAIHARIHRWAATLTDHGIATLYRSIIATEGLPARVVATIGGERELTDLGHVAELLHAESAASQMGVPTLRAWLARRVAEGESDEADAEERARRLDSDADAVQVITVHRAKGLEFGVVYCPYLWDAAPGGRAAGPVIFHDPDRGGTRTLDVGCPDRSGPARKLYDRHRQISSGEDRGEDLRLMYVALTRARHQVVLWWGRADQCRHSPLGRLLMSRDPTTGFVSEARASDPTDGDIRRALGTLLERARPGLVATEVAGESGSVVVGAPGRATADGAPLHTARFDRVLDWRWRRASYSSITAAAYEHVGKNVSSEPENPGLDDEPLAPAGPTSPSVLAPSTGAGWPASPLALLPAGPEFGTYVHNVLQQADFAAQDSLAELEAATAVGSVPFSLDPAVVASGLAAALTTPLGPTLPGTYLRDLSRADRIDELRFELPLAGGDQPAGQVSTSDVAAVLAALWPADGVLAGYPSLLMDPLLATDMRGYLTGSLDLVFRHRGADGTERWYVADYKTNWLGEEGRPLTSWHYRPAALDMEMQRHHYPLQALLYLVALHRYLRWRLPGYSPEAHLGGVLYLFLRGMVGPSTPLVDGQPCGVFSWVPTAQLIVALSGLFGRGH